MLFSACTCSSRRESFVSRTVHAALAALLFAMALSPASAYGGSTNPSHHYDYDSPIVAYDGALNLASLAGRGSDLGQPTARLLDEGSGPFFGPWDEPSAPRAAANATDDLPTQLHHFATNKNAEDAGDR